MSTGQEHTVKAFDEDIKHLRALISQMGGLAEEAISDAMAALERGDVVLAKQVRAKDKAIDAIEAEVEKLAVRVIALRAPMADDLRDCVAALKIAGVVERIGDYAKNIAKRVPLIHTSGGDRIEAISVIPAMAQLASEMVHEVLDAFSARDAEGAIRVIERDNRLDDFYDSIFRTLVTYMVENPRTVSEVAHTAVRGQEYRADRRPCDQCRGDGLFCCDRPVSGGSRRDRSAGGLT